MEKAQTTILFMLSGDAVCLIEDGQSPKEAYPISFKTQTRISDSGLIHHLVEPKISSKRWELKQDGDELFAYNVAD